MKWTKGFYIEDAVSLNYIESFTYNLEIFVSIFICSWYVLSSLYAAANVSNLVLRSKKVDINQQQ